MMGKLTENEVGRICFEMAGDHRDVWCEGRDKLWSRIESDREAIREETRAEVLRDHFRIGEDIVYDSARDGSTRKGFIWINDKEESSLSKTSVVEFSHNARRPPKKRAMTRKERQAAIVQAMGRGYSWLDTISEFTLDELARHYNIPTEVEE